MNGDAVYARCNCKTGQGGCCKLVAALLYTLLDYVNMGIQEIPIDLTTTQVGQKWHVLSGANNVTFKAFKFHKITVVLEKLEKGKKRKRAVLCESRELSMDSMFSFCSLKQARPIHAKLLAAKFPFGRPEKCQACVEPSGVLTKENLEEI